MEYIEFFDFYTLHHIFVSNTQKGEAIYPLVSKTFSDSIYVCPFVCPSVKKFCYYYKYGTNRCWKKLFQDYMDSFKNMFIFFVRKITDTVIKINWADTFLKQFIF